MKKWIVSAVVVLSVVVVSSFGFLYLYPVKALTLIGSVERGKAGLKDYDITVEGIHYRYLKGGQGEPLILIHGFGANKDNWTRISQYLTPHFTVIAPDLPGFGESDRVASGMYGIRVQAGRVKAFADALGYKTFHLGGSSMGGNISAAIASTYKDSVKSLWLVAPGGVPSPHESDMRKQMKGGSNPLIAESLDEYKKVMDLVFHEKPYVPDLIIRAFAKEAVANRSVNESIFKQLHKGNGWAVDTVKELTGSDIPTLILWGDKDRVLHVSGAEVLGKVMKKATVNVMKDTGHLPMVENPEASARNYLAFVEEQLTNG